MKTKKIALFSCVALVAVGIGLNIQNAIADYGIDENSYSLVAVPGSGSNSNSNSNSDSNGIKVKLRRCIGDDQTCIKPSGTESTGVLVEVEVDFEL